jgi:dihydroxyacetone kinase-like protein
MASDDGLDLPCLRRVLLGVCDAMDAAVEDFTHADQAIGDGDHGLAIGRGFRSAAAALSDRALVDVGDLFGGMGDAMLSSMGGASGAIYGTLFRRGGRALHGRLVFDSEALAIFLEDGLAGVRERGRAAVGDKTIVDALQPAAVAARASVDCPLAEALVAVAEAAGGGLQRTKELRATIGKARALGDRSIGYVDPGALSFTVMVRKFSQLVAEAK